MAAMTANLEAIDSQNIIEHVKETEKYIRETFTNPAIQEIKGKGLLLGLVLDRPAQPIQAELFKREIIVGLNSDPNQIHLLPPLNIDHALFDQ